MQRHKNTCPTCGALTLFPVEAQGMVSELYKDWLTDIEAGGCTAFYVAQLMQQYRDYILPVFGGHRPQDIRTKDLAKLRRSLLRRLAPKTAKNILGALSALLNHLAESGELEAVPRFPRVAVKPTREKHWMDARSQAWVIAEADPDDRLIFRGLIETGERVSEACAHQVRDLQDGGIRVCRAFDEYGVLKATKTGTDDLRPLSTALYGELMGRCRVNSPGQWLYTRDGQPYTRRKLRYRWQVTCKRAGVEYVPISQASRHSRASQLRLKLEAEMSEHLRAALNHESAATTRRHYALGKEARVEIAE